MKILCCLLFTFAMCGCAHNPTADQRQAGTADQKVTCHVERDNSTTILKRNCRTEKQNKADQRQAERILEKVRRRPPTVGLGM